MAKADEYRFICWLAGKVPSAKVIRDLLREERKGVSNNESGRSSGSL